jgi:hypothetical protein
VTEQAVANANRQPVGGDSTAEWSPEPGDFVVVPASYAGPGLTAGTKKRIVRAKVNTPVRKNAKAPVVSHKPAPKLTAARR